jgi:recombinational DNA repair protein (RecF pathway)
MARVNEKAKANQKMRQFIKSHIKRKRYKIPKSYRWVQGTSIPKKVGKQKNK